MAGVLSEVAGFSDLELRRLVASVLGRVGPVDTISVLVYMGREGAVSLDSEVLSYLTEFSSKRARDFTISDLVAGYQSRNLDEFLSDLKENVSNWFGIRIEIDKDKLIMATKRDFRFFLKDIVDFVESENVHAFGSYRKWLNQVIEYLKDEKSAVLLTGRAGSGKTTLVYLLAKEIEKTQFSEYSVAKVDVDAETLSVLKLLSSENVIAFIDEAHRLDKETVNGLKPLISETGLKLILATTSDEAGELLRDEAFKRRLKEVKVEPEEEDVIGVMNLKFRNVGGKVREEVVFWAFNFSNNESPMSLADKILREISKGASPEEASSRILMVSRRALKPSGHKITSLLKERVLFQDEALEKIARWLTGYLKGLRRGKPLSFIFTGPTGTGKTLTARVIAEVLKGKDSLLHVINMGSYQNEGDVWRLLGSAKGFVGSDEESPLRRIYRSDPFPVILFDEVEKAHPRIWDAFLSLTDTGEIEDNKGVLNFKNSVIIFTSNATADSPVGFVGGGTTESKLRGTFRPEFVGRLIPVEFSPLDREKVERLVDIKVDEVIRKNRTALRGDLDLNILKQRVKERLGKYSGLGIREIEAKIEETLIDLIT